MKEQLEEEWISIVIPIYNAAPYLKRTLDSVLDQTFHKWELILVEDGSKDESIQVIQEWLESNGFLLYEQENKYKCKKSKECEIVLLGDGENHGAAYARNVGIAQAKGRYLAYLDADDYWTSDKLEKQYCFMKEKECAFSFTGYAFANAEGIRNRKEVHVPQYITYEEALMNTTISTITVMFDRKKIPTNLLYMPEDCQREDTATWWKILKNGYTAYGLDEVLSVYCRHRDSHSANKIKAVLGTYKMYRRQEKLSFGKTMICMVQYICGAIKRRL